MSRQMAANSIHERRRKALASARGMKRQLGVLCLFTFFGAPAVGAAFGALISDWQTNRIPGTIVVFVIASIGATVFAFLKTRGEVTVIAQEGKIKFGDKVYDRRHFGGMRIGYTVDSTDGSLKEHFLDQQMGYAALRLTYGRL